MTRPGAKPPARTRARVLRELERAQQLLAFSLAEEEGHEVARHQARVQRELQQVQVGRLKAAERGARECLSDAKARVASHVAQIRTLKRELESIEKSRRLRATKPDGRTRHD